MSRYEILEEDAGHYLVHNIDGKNEWYAKSKFVEVSDDNNNNGISADLVAAIEKEIADTARRMTELQKELKDAKTPKTKNLMLRATQERSDWYFDRRGFGASVTEALDNLSDALFASGDGFQLKDIVLRVAHQGDGIELDKDYDWKIEMRGTIPVLVVLER